MQRVCDILKDQEASKYVIKEAFKLIPNLAIEPASVDAIVKTIPKIGETIERFMNSDNKLHVIAIESLIYLIQDGK
jgi:hypothetical protein